MSTILIPPKKNRLWKNKAEFFRPFRNVASTAAHDDNDLSLYDPEQASGLLSEPDLQELNNALETLAEIFPDVEPEVFREMLPRVSRDSRAQLVADHLLSHKRTQLVRGRNRSRVAETSALKASAPLRAEDMFRAREYQSAVRDVFFQEFKNLSKSTIRGVMAEQNYSYTMTRPILQQLASKSWRFSFSILWGKRAAAAAVGDHPFIIWQPDISSDRPSIPFVKRTSSVLLDQELYELFVQPVILRQRKELMIADYEHASEINQADAEAAEALFECECCCDTVTFERLATCDYECHQLCLECIHRTVKEALYGQGWNKTVDLQKGTICCLSAAAPDCPGSVPISLVQRALLPKDGYVSDIWQEFDARLANETLKRSSLTLQRCPFCEYAETSETPHCQRKSWAKILHSLWHRKSFGMACAAMLAVVSTIFLAVPMFVLIISVWLAFRLLPGPATHLRASWERVHNKRQGLRFHCRRPSCQAVSCKRCAVRWQDPHTCFETQTTSLRTALELSATAAIKRTCPKCMLSFVKSSGCNKLVCNCGYTMCYICRQEITSKEGYNHFCQHFRPNGGRCDECERCDLYGDEDEEDAIRTATLAAERAWREKEGLNEAMDPSAGLAIETLVGRAPQLTWYESWLDSMVDILAA